MSHGKSYLHTTPGTQLEWSTARRWCAGHPWRRRRGLGWLHRLGHRARILRVKGPARPLVYLTDTKGAAPMPDGDFPCCAPGAPAAGHVSLRCKLHAGQPHTPCSGTCDGHGTGRPCGQPCECPCHAEAEFLAAGLGLFLGLMLADLLGHPEAARWLGNMETPRPQALPGLGRPAED